MELITCQHFIRESLRGIGQRWSVFTAVPQRHSDPGDYIRHANPPPPLFSSLKWKSSKGEGTHKERKQEEGSEETICRDGGWGRMQEINSRTVSHAHSGAYTTRHCTKSKLCEGRKEEGGDGGVFGLELPIVWQIGFSSMHF